MGGLSWGCAAVSEAEVSRGASVPGGRGLLDPVEEDLNTYRKLFLWGETCLPVVHPPSSSKTVGLGDSDSWGFGWDTTVF